MIIIVLAGGAAYIALLNGEYDLEENMSIWAPKELVFGRVNNLTSWEEWFFSKDKYHHYTISENPVGENAWFSWTEDSLKTEGKLTATKVIHSSLIEQKAYHQKKIGQIDYQITWNFHSKEDSTYIDLKVKRKLDFLSKAVQLIKGKPNENTLKSLTDKRLKSLKTKIVNDMAVYSVHVDGIMNTPPTPYIFSTQAARNIPENLIEKHLHSVESLKKFAKTNEIELSGQEFILFNQIDEERQSVIISSCIPVAREVQITDPASNILSGMIEEQMVLKSTLRGHYRNMPELWDKARIYLKENKLRQNHLLSVREVFKITMADSHNPAEWITELYIPIENITEIELSSEIPENQNL